MRCEAVDGLRAVVTSEIGRVESSIVPMLSVGFVSGGGEGDVEVGNNVTLGACDGAVEGGGGIGAGTGTGIGDFAPSVRGRVDARK
jgi:hypothetical protein